ncbi:hypothetical protein pb186bvf_000511 [Paramecium bursaria]
MYPSRPPRYLSVRPNSSLAEENQAKYFKIFQTNQKATSVQNNIPQRIELPLFFNTPIRNNKLNIVRQNEKTMDMKYKQLPELNIILSSKRRLKDYEMLAFACKRAGKLKDEGRAYYSIGVLYDNLGKWQKAIEYYEKFLQICQTLQDSHAQGLAHNCIGVDYQLLALEKPSLIHKAIEHHKIHEEISDINGKFLASINLGLCYEYDQRQSIFYFQQALKYATQVSSLVGQTMALGNIGKIGQRGLYDNTEKMQAFIEKYLTLAQNIEDRDGQIQGHLKLGTLSSTKGNYTEGKENFQKALTMVEKDDHFYNQAKCGFAIASAEIQMDQYLLQQGRYFKS